MTTLFATTFCPQVATKLFWIKTNRVLAWSMIASPVVEIAAGVPLIVGLSISLALLVAHGLLSLVLFGKPETKSKAFEFGMHVVGIRAPGLSDRHRFLLTGYRIAIATVAIALATFTSYGAFVPLLCIYPLIRLPFTVMQHIYVAVKYAVKRWRVRDAANFPAEIVVGLYVLVSFFNLIKG